MTDQEYAARLYREAFKAQPASAGVPVGEILNDLAKLKEQQRMALESRFRHGHKYTRISEELGVSEPLAGQIVSTALLILRHLFLLRIK